MNVQLSVNFYQLGVVLFIESMVVTKILAQPLTNPSPKLKFKHETFTRLAMSSAELALETQWILPPSLLTPRLGQVSSISTFFDIKESAMENKRGGRTYIGNKRNTSTCAQV